MPFLIIMVSGLAGMLVMALPGFFSHGHSGHGHAGHGHGAHSSHAAAHGGKMTVQPNGALRLVPQPRTILSLTALYGAFGLLLEQTAQWSVWPAALGAVVPAVMVERFILRPLWSWAMRFQGVPSSALESLVLDDARAVTHFRNGKGLVSVVRDGREVQLSARLSPEHAGLLVKTGDRLRIEDVDAEAERVTVSVKI